MSFYPTDTSENIYTVSRLNQEARYLLEDVFASIWIEGEISNFSAPHSGHWYFSLKDNQAQVRCALFRGNQRQLNFTPKDGLHVLIKARVSLYENRGEFQLIAEHIEERGEGKLRRAFELLKKKLEAEGLFNEDHKKTLPLYPKQIGVITSATGAAIRDILTVLKRRFAYASVTIYPTMVQGATAAPAIVEAIQTANRRHECDVLILARGGGSLEDLWAFNEEIVARAIYQSDLPIVTGIGHEVDFTIADFVADKRAATPSAAAELISPDGAQLLAHIKKFEKQLILLTQQQLQSLKKQLDWLTKHLSQQHPKHRLANHMQALDYLSLSLIKLEQQLLAQLRETVHEKMNSLLRFNPIYPLQTLQHQLTTANQTLCFTIKTKLNTWQSLLAHQAALLQTLSPLTTLDRGYAIVTQANRIITNTDHVKVGDHVEVKLAKGSLFCIVENKNN